MSSIEGRVERIDKIAVESKSSISGRSCAIDMFMECTSSYSLRVAIQEGDEE